MIQRLSAMPERMMPRWADRCPKAYEVYRKVYAETNQALKACRVPSHIVTCVNAALAQAWTAGQDSAKEEADKVRRADEESRGARRPLGKTSSRKPTK